MAKQSPAGPLEGTVSVVGARPTVSLADRDAPVAELSVALTGGGGGDPVPITFSVGLNVPVAGRAQLMDDARGTILAESTRSGSIHMFRNVPVTPPGNARTRTFRIVNVRANANGLGGSPSLIPTQIIAFVSLSGPFRIPLVGSQQNVASLRRQ
jgi:hypothetical protein